MSDKRMLRRWLTVAVTTLLAGVLAGAVIASRADDGSDLIAAIEEAPLTKIADIAAADGAPARGVYVQETKTGHICVWEAPSATSRQRGGGCNTADDPLNGAPVSATLSYDGGPALSDVSGATVFGLAASDVGAVRIEMNDGTSRDVKLKKAKVGADELQAFGYRVRKSDLKRGIGPTAVVAFDASGIELGRQPTGIGG